jgi:hypothetical protein
MKLGDQPSSRSMGRLDDAADRAAAAKQQGSHSANITTQLAETTDRRLVLLGSMSGAGVVMTGALLAVAMRSLDLNPVAATTAAIIVVGGIGSGLALGGCFSLKLVPRVKQEGLLGNPADSAWEGNPLEAWDTPDDVNVDKRYRL